MKRFRHPAYMALAALAGLVAVTVAPLASGGVRSAADSGRLVLRAEFAVKAKTIDCPGGKDQPYACFASEGESVMPGLGKVSESYLRRIEEGPADCAPGYFRIQSQTVRFSVAGKGEIQLVVPATGCLNFPGVLKYPPFTITGGSGAYAGASGTGTLSQRSGLTSYGMAGTDSWAGNLAVPGLEFDVTAPTLSGAVAKTVRAPKGATGVRVTYHVSASDAVDGPIPVSCKPKSGSRFRVGRTPVSCSATDTSGNTRTTKFTITVKAKR